MIPYIGRKDTQRSLFMFFNKIAGGTWLLSCNFSAVMPSRIFILCLCLLLPARFMAMGQAIQGEVLDVNDGKPVANVSVINVYTGIGMATGGDGKFYITAGKNELVEFRKLGYKITRVRIPAGSVPPYFKIIIQKGPIELPEVNIAGQAKDYKTDSLKYHELYKHELDFPTMSTLDMIQHPFTALSKRNREVWAFQKEYDHFQKEKYIDYTFSPELVSKITGLPADSVQRYLRFYRPSYEQLRSMNEYTFYNYIKQTVARYRSLGRSVERGVQ